MFVCVKMYPAMITGVHESECVCVSKLKMYPALVYGDHEGECVCVCVENVSSYSIWCS